MHRGAPTPRRYPDRLDDNPYETGDPVNVFEVSGRSRAMVLPSKPEYWDDIEPGLLILVGFLLFVFPEPATSVLGAGLLLLGASWWFYEWGR